ncbi:MAG: 2-oxo acid dehydrogenase subunit E2 [Pseudolabrys sp.]
MPQLGETVTEGKITKWFKAAGDAVKPGENLFEIETDKTSMEVPSIATGTLTDIRFGVGEVAKVGAVIAVISGAREAAPAKPAGAKPAEVPKSIPPSPLVPAKAGTQSSFALDPRLRGGERSQSRDFAYADMSPWREVRTPERNYGPAKLATGSAVTPLARRLASERGIDLARVAGSGPHGRIVATDIDKAPRPAETAQAAQFNLVADVEISRLIVMRDEAKAAGADFSLGDFVVKAWAMTLKRVTPEANTDIGLMTNVDGRRVTKAIRDAAGKSLTVIAQEAREQSADAPPPDAGVVSAVSIHSAPGIREFTAVVAPPLASVLAVAAPRRAPVEAGDGTVKFVDQVTVTLSCDHRMVDDVLGAELLAAFKALMENPVAALV